MTCRCSAISLSSCRMAKKRFFNVSRRSFSVCLRCSPRADGTDLSPLFVLLFLGGKKKIEYSSRFSPRLSPVAVVHWADDSQRRSPTLDTFLSVIFFHVLLLLIDFAGLVANFTDMDFVSWNIVSSSTLLSKQGLPHCWRHSQRSSNGSNR